MSRLEQLQKMLAADPRDSFLNFALAKEYANHQQPDEALRQFERVNELDPAYVPGWFQHGNLLVSLGRRQEARDIYNIALRKAKENGDTHAAAELQEALQLLE